MSRLWSDDGFDHAVNFSPGSLTGLTDGPMSWAVLLLPVSPGFDGIFTARNGTTVSFFAVVDNTPAPVDIFAGFDGSGAQISMADLITAGDHQIIGYSKPSAGSAQCRGHYYNYTTGPPWTHFDGTTAGGGPGGTIDNLRMGLVFGGDRLSAHKTVAAVWLTGLSDADFETLRTTLAAWVALDPAECWPMNQASDSDPIVSITGSADQTSVTGTAPTVSAEEPPGWSYDLAAESASPAAPPLPPHLLLQLAAANQDMWYGGTSPPIAAAGDATSEQRSTTTTSGVKNATGTTTAAQRSTTLATGASGTPSGAGLAVQRSTTTATTAKGGVGAGHASARTSSTSSGVKRATAAATAPQRSTTTGTTRKQGSGATNATAHPVTTSAAKRSTAGASSATTKTATTTTGSRHASGTATATMRSVTQATGQQVAPYTPVQVGIDGALTISGIDSGLHTGTVDASTTITGNIG